MPEQTTEAVKSTEEKNELAPLPQAPDPVRNPPKTVEPTGKIFLSEQDRKAMKKANQHLVTMLNLRGSRSVKV